MVSEFKEYTYTDKDNENVPVVARKVEEENGEDVMTPGGQRIRAAKGDYILEIPASAYGVYEVVRGDDKPFNARGKKPEVTPENLAADQAKTDEAAKAKADAAAAAKAEAAANKAGGRSAAPSTSNNS